MRTHPAPGEPFGYAQDRLVEPRFERVIKCFAAALRSPLPSCIFAGDFASFRVSGLTRWC